MAYIGQNPKFVTETLRPQSADPSNPVEGMIFRSDGTPRTEGLWEYINGAWQIVGTTAFSASSSYLISNLGIAATVGASALTVAIKTAAGSNPTGSDKVTVAFRNATAGTGQFSAVDITGALSMVISSGSTLGQRAAVAAYINVYLINNAGTAEIAISRSLYDDGSVVSTTAEGGAGAADSASTIYSTTARSNVPLRLVGRLLNTQATAGTWATNPSEISLQPFSKYQQAARFTRGSAQSFTAATYVTVDWDGVTYNTHNALSSGAYTLSVSGIYHVTATLRMNAINASASTYIGIALNGSTSGQLINLKQFKNVDGGTANNIQVSVTDYYSFSAGDVLRVLVYSDNTESCEADPLYNYFAITYVGPIV